MERFVENPDFLQELFLEEAWKNVDKIDGFIESKANTEEFEVTTEEEGMNAFSLLGDIYSLLLQMAVSAMLKRGLTERTCSG